MKMKSTPRGKAILKLIYWAIFFIILFLLFSVASLFQSDNPPVPVTEDEPIKQEQDTKKSLDVLESELLSSTYRYQYYIEENNNSYFFEGLKALDHIEGYKSYNGISSGVLRYYIDQSGTYEIKGEEKVLITNLYEGLQKNFLNLESLFQIMNQLPLMLDQSNSYPVYTAKDANYQYTLNISKEGTVITDISIVSLDNLSSYLLSFTDVLGEEE